MGDHEEKDFCLEMYQKTEVQLGYRTVVIERCNIHGLERYACFLVTPWIWHPNVTQDGGIIICDNGEDPIDLLQTDVFHNPCNTDAAIMAHRNKINYIKLSRKIEEQYHSVTECMICLEENIPQIQRCLVCPVAHWICKGCSAEQTKRGNWKKCPLKCNSQ